MNDVNEEERLQQLIRDNVDIELLFLKYLLDREVTEKKMGDYAFHYIELTEAQKWEFAKRYKAEINKDIFLWQDFLQTIEIPLEQFREHLDKNSLI